MRAKACIKCKEYVLLHPDDPLSQNKENMFAKNHHHHTLITVSLEEINDTYKPFKFGTDSNSLG